MFKRGIFATIVVLLAASNPAAAQPPAPVQSPALPAALATAITAAYDNQCALLKSTDIEGYSKTLTAGWTGTNPDGSKATKAQAIDAIKQQIAASGLTVTGCSVAITGGTVSPDGNLVSVTVAQSANGTVATPDGTTAPISVSTTETDAWVKRGSNWLQRASAISKSTIMLNGQVVQQSGSR